jgi:hypothetical protein
VEAYHAGIIRDQLYRLQIEGATTPDGTSIAQAVELISSLRDAVDGPDDLDQGILEVNAKGKVMYNGDTTLVPTDGNALTFLRTIDQVLAIVYLGRADVPGGFLPEGVTGFFGPVRSHPSFASGFV